MFHCVSKTETLTHNIRKTKNQIKRKVSW